MKKLLTISLLTILPLLVNAQLQDTITTYTHPEIPSMITEPHARMVYLAEHYWDRVDFRDPNYARHPEITEQAYVNFIDILRRLPLDVADYCIKAMMRSAEKAKNNYMYMANLCDKYLNDPNSPFRSEDLYIPVLEEVTKCQILSKDERIRPVAQLKVIRMNRPGMPARDFSMTLPDGSRLSLYDIESPYVLLYLNTPGCEACRKTINAIRLAPNINKRLKSGQLVIVAVDPDLEREDWENNLSDYPSSWINAYDDTHEIMNRPLYDLKAMPTIYLLDSTKHVLLKDCTVNQADRALRY